MNVVDRDNVTAKADYNLSNAHKLSGRFLWNRQDSGIRSVYAIPAAEPGTTSIGDGWNLLGSWTTILRPTLINELRADGVTRTALIFTQGVGLNYPTKLGLQGIPDDAFPRFNINGYTALGSNQQRRDQTPIQQGQFTDTMTWIKGTHSIRFGTDLRRSRNRDYRLQLASGAFTFSKAITGLTGRTTTGNGVAALLLGMPSAFQAAKPPVIDRRSWYVSGFIQDDWQVASNLVLNLGLRWELDTPFGTQDNILNGFDPNAINPVSRTPGVVKFAGVNGYPSSPHKIDWNNFAPRVGFAWKPFGSSRTVVRGAFGIFFAAPYDGGTAVTSVTLGYGDSLVIPTDQDGATIPFRLRDPIPVKIVRNTLDDSYGAVPAGTTPTTAINFYDRNRATGYSQQMNLAVQRELTGSMMAELGYLGNLSRKMAGASLSINQVRPELLTAGANQSRRPYPQFSDVLMNLPLWV